ncbi:glycoside hydrolase family 88 protein [Salisediminibacterium selenitireducens]|uniref:Glycosyl hydrolase family 88 n=1 Tax=Bacillus selenitireducens (strain ATCC 700615 / DSM 15326 / MLS10) TaxID=439292 RepID=D6XXD2_BACIE|nr:glycoside hydrolase family 88 protein [Salisediminibacterium selenitireducens]ADH97989.1 glycosyl hydrolase family 88 [[Bacillus] selenitireducens MLS10]
MTPSDIKKLIIKRTSRNLKKTGGLYPHVGDDGIYRLIKNEDWTNGFWSGVLWECYEGSGDSVFLNAAKEETKSFEKRMTDNVVLDHHDLGFLYSLSSKADWIITGDESARLLSIQAADRLLQRWRSVGGYIQAWGNKGDKTEGGRMIIDCLLNLPLLFWATKTTGNSKYEVVARQQAEQTLRYLVRGDGSSYHTFIFNQKTGEPVGGTTHQGSSNGSTWSRGQAWGVYGFALLYRFTKEERYLVKAKEMLDYFLRHQPEQGLISWDFNASQKEEHYTDSSAMAIALCGMLELREWTDPSESERLDTCINLFIQNLADYALIKEDDPEKVTGLLHHASYYVRGGDVPDGSVIWGDYFFTEAIMRMTDQRTGYWYERSSFHE